MRLIDADALERDGWSMSRTFQEDKDTMVYEVKKPSDFPTIEERKTGKWLDIKLFGTCCIECSECNFTEMDIPESRSKFCPNCGAKMEG